MKKLTLLFVAIIMIALTSNKFAQGIPETINYQGVLKDAAGVVVNNGDYNLTFKLYDVESGGTSIWSETKLITVASGIVNTQLGSVTPIPQATFNSALWLGITVAAGTELIPRIALASVPYSMYSLNVPNNSITATKIANSQIVKGLNGLKDNINLVAGSNVTITPSGNDITISSTGGGSGIGGSGTVDYIAKFTGGTSIGGSIISETAGKIGLDDNTSSYKLSINTTNTTGLGLKIHRIGGTNLLIKSDSSPTDEKGWAFNVFSTKLQIRTIADDDATTLSNVMTFQRDGNVGIGTTTPVTTLDVNGTATLSGTGNELNRTQTGDANLVPIAYGNVNPDATFNLAATTSNVSLSSHTTGSGIYYFNISGETIHYTTHLCIATLRSGSGEIVWSSSGGTLYISTHNSDGTNADKSFSFVLYKK